MLPFNHNKIRKIFATCDIWWPRLINSGMFSLYRKHRSVFDCQGAKEGHKDTPEIDPRSLEEVLTNGCTHLAGWECRLSEMNLQVLPIVPDSTSTYFYMRTPRLELLLWTFAHFFGALPTCCTHSSTWNKITNIYKQHTFQYISYQSVCHQRALCLHSAQACGKSGAPLPDHHARMLRWFSTWVAVTGLLGGRVETLRQDFSALYQHASFVKDCHEKSPPNPLLSIVILKGRPYILGYFNCADTSCRPHSISAVSRLRKDPPTLPPLPGFSGD